jgi:hypothetical protein
VSSGFLTSAGFWSAVGGVASAAAAFTALRIAKSSLDTQLAAETRALEERKSQREKELRAQASLVSTWSEKLITQEEYREIFGRPPRPPRDQSNRWRPVVVFNASDSPIYEVYTWQCLDSYNDKRDAPEPPSRKHFTYRSVVVPKDHFRTAPEVSGSGAEHLPDTGVKFRDQNNNVWWRDFSGILHLQASANGSSAPSDADARAGQAEPSHGLAG